MAKNKRQPYAVKDMAGMGHSAESWGTGRAVARIPRISGGGTSRSGQGAFGNMCRKGRMFAPTKTWRKWHRKINTNQKRYAVASALAASALPALVMARGHRVNNVLEVPLVLENSVESISKTKDAIKMLKAVGAFDDVLKAKNSRKLRCGSGKARNRRHVMRRGPLVVFSEDNGLTKAVRNLPGVETCDVTRLNLLQLAPGGHMGRFIVWTQGAFSKLHDLFGSVTRESTQKKGYKLPRNSMVNGDITRVINSDEVQSVLRAAKECKRTHSKQKKNPLKNFGVMVKLNPYAMNLRRAELLAQEKRAAARAAKKAVLSTVEAKRRAAKAGHAATAKLTYARISGDAYDVQATALCTAAAEKATTDAQKKDKLFKITVDPAEISRVAAELETKAKKALTDKLFDSAKYKKARSNTKIGAAGSVKDMSKVALPKHRLERETKTAAAKKAKIAQAIKVAKAKKAAPKAAAAPKKK